MTLEEKTKPPHPFYLFSEFQSDLGILIGETIDVIKWATSIEDHRRKRQLARIAIVYIAFAAQAVIDLRSSAGWMTRKFNEFGKSQAPPKQIGFPPKGRTKQLKKIVERLRWARNMVAHPYRVEADGRDRPMNV
jgi:hypothetical protein